jgi:hypothetical protein
VKNLLKKTLVPGLLALSAAGVIAAPAAMAATSAPVAVASTVTANPGGTPLVWFHG